MNSNYISLSPLTKLPAVYFFVRYQNYLKSSVPTKNKLVHQLQHNFDTEMQLKTRHNRL